MVELFGVFGGRIDHVHEPLTTHPESPLQVHARYSRIEILASFGPGIIDEDDLVAIRNTAGRSTTARSQRSGYTFRVPSFAAFGISDVGQR